MVPFKMKKNIIIFGSGSHSKVVFSEIINLQCYNILGFVDDFAKKGKKIFKYDGINYFNLGGIKNFLKYKNTNKFINRSAGKNICGIIGVGFNYIREKIRDQVIEIDKNFKWETIISKNAILNGKIKIGKGSLIMSGVVINTQTKIGDHCIINTSSSIDHDNKFKNFSSCGPGVITGGNVTIGKYSYLGIGSVVKQGLKIGSSTVIGGNSFVNKNCSNNFIYYGVPIRKIRKRKHDENYF
jgi:sugar O-acyltransferase (sialic acid O-acetyltransferase NeuD family)